MKRKASKGAEDKGPDGSQEPKEVPVLLEGKAADTEGTQKTAPPAPGGSGGGGEGPGPDQTAVAKRVIDQNIADEMQRSYIDYAMSVIIGRALPDVRDGLKPVHRRILYGMSELGNTHDKPYKKSARIVGEVLGKFHPHGDIAVYDTLVRMAQDFSLRYTLVDGQGNFGSVDGDSAAHMRYTEARMDKIAKELLGDLEKATIPWGKNFDETLDEPLVLPAKLPNLLVNGSQGIAVGMATNMPPHNLGEVVDALNLVIDNPETCLADIMRVLPGPDFPTGGIIYGQGGIIEAYTTGRGPISVRAKTAFEERKGGGFRIVVTEIPYMVNKSTLLETIAQLVKNKVIEGITDLRDESDRDGMRVVIELSRDKIDSDKMAEVVLNQLFKHTSLQTTFGVINIAIVDGQPKTLPLKELLFSYINFRKDVVRKRAIWELNRAQDREHILAGLIIAQNNLDEVIKTIRKSKDPAEAQEKLMVKFKLSEIQAKAILDMKLQKLTGLEVEALRKEEKEVKAEIERLQKILADEKEILAIIKKELAELKENYGDNRRTQIELHTMDLDIEHLVPNEKVVVQITNDDYFKRIPASAFKAQHRGGVGLIGTRTKEEDFVVDLFATMTHDYIMFFTNKGRTYWLKAYRIPERSRYARGIPIVQKIEGLQADEYINATIPVHEFDARHFVVFITKRGRIKKTPLLDYSHIRRTGVQAIKLYEGDEVVATKLTDGNKDIIIATREGKAIRFNETDVRSMGRVSHGVRGVRLRGEDAVVAMAVAEPEDILLTITEKGFGKRTQIKAYRKTRRGGLGVANIKITEKNGKVVTSVVVQDDEELLVTSKNGMIIRMPIKDIPVKKGRAVMGVRVMRCREGDKVVAIAKLLSEQEVIQAVETPLACEKPGAPLPQFKPVEVEGPEEEAGELPEDEPEEEPEEEEEGEQPKKKRGRGRPKSKPKSRKKDFSEEE
jgi:DNA gyrase subunit A